MSSSENRIHKNNIALLNVKSMTRKLGMLPALIALYLLMFVLTMYFSGGESNFVTASNTMNILRQVSINTVLASGMTFVILTGGIDLSVGSILAVSAVAGMVISLSSTFAAFSIPVFLLTGLVLGLANGVLVAYAGLNPFVVTLGTMTALRGAAYLLAGGTSVLNQQIPSFEWMGNDAFLSVPWLIWLAMLVVVISWFILRKTPLGLQIYAVGGNQTAARLTGINLGLVLTFVYALSGLFSGLGGAMSASRLYAASGNWGNGYELDAIAAVVLGGTSLTGGVGSIWGTAVGALIIGVVNNGLTILGLSSFWQYVAKGAVIVAAVMLDRWRRSHSSGT
jgi:ribose transport system permease protein